MKVKNTNIIMTLENCSFISITNLTKKGVFNNSLIITLGLTKNNEHFLSLNAEFIVGKNENFIVFTYLNNTERDNCLTQKIKVALIPSNIGNGFVKYFICPVTGKYCRKLYYHKMSFKHREATGLLYEQQTKKQPISLAGYLTTEQRNEPNTKNFKKYYKGDMTKRYFRILLKTSHSEVVDAYRKGMLKIR